MEEPYPKRKANRLCCFNYSAAGYYFITICAKNKEKLFGTIVGGGALDAPQLTLTEIGKTVDRYIRSTDRIHGLYVDIYVIMPNHLHLILAVTEDTTEKNQARANELIPHAIGTLKRFVNRDVGYNVFQRGYHDHVIRGEQDYQKIWSYIDDNPRRWKDDCFYAE